MHLTRKARTTHFMDSTTLDGINHPNAHHRRLSAPSQSFSFIRYRFVVFETRVNHVSGWCARRACDHLPDPNKTCGLSLMKTNCRAPWPAPSMGVLLGMGGLLDVSTEMSCGSASLFQVKVGMTRRMGCDHGKDVKPLSFPHSSKS